MKNYQKAELIAKNLPTGSYAAGCPTHHQGNNTTTVDAEGHCWSRPSGCSVCELAG